MAYARSLTIQPAMGSFPDRIRDAVKRAWIGHWTRRAERATVLVLHALDDRTLKDIGMDRSEIESVVYSAGRDRSGSNGRRLCMAARSVRR